MLVEEHAIEQFPRLYEQASVTASQSLIDRQRILVRDERAKQWRESGQAVLRKLEKASQFTRDELREFKKAFDQMLDEKKAKIASDPHYRRKKKSGKLRDSTTSVVSNQYVEVGISKNDFLRIVERLNPSLSEISAKLFDKYDEDRSGYLDFRELVVCLSLLSKGSFEEKLRVCYDLFDVDHSGYLSEDELEALLTSVANHLKQTNTPEEAQQALGPVRDILRYCLADDNMVSWSEFHGCIMRDPVAFQIFAMHVESSETVRYSTGHLVKAVAGTGEEEKQGKGEEMRKEEPEQQKTCGSCLLL